MDERRKHERRGKVVDVSHGGVDLASCPHPLERAALGDRREEGDRAAAIGDLDRLTLRYEAE